MDYLLAQVNAAHRQVLRRRRHWFERMAEAQSALWWILRGQIPTTDEAEARVLHLREFGPTPFAFSLKEHFPPPDTVGFLAGPQPGGMDLSGLIRTDQGPGTETGGRAA